MQISNFNTVEELNDAGADFMITHLQGGQSKLLCAATGSSSTGIYKNFVSRKAETTTGELNIITLDEWIGLPVNHPGSCDYYLHQYLLQPLNIPADHYTSFDSKAMDAEVECKRMVAELAAKGPIDLCVLGIGLNGHIAFNEPADELQPGVHVAKLSEASMAHPMVSGVAEKPQHGYTLGLGDILNSKAILLVIHGKAKRAIFQQLSAKKISTQVPASFLWLHPNVHCYYCEN